ncbi:MAG: SDR family NAD(P)-dependent oxidoreductase [Solirubrobacterales bacterium]|nr:SDR family NAD(P)-dependent oxidoreductase [Solirubrobacterales bacterium]
MKTLNRRVALVTGASGGIGQAIARGLAAEGAAVALGYSSHAEPAEKLAEELVPAGGLAVAVGADLSRAEAPDQLVDAVEGELGAVEVLVAAAGLARRQELEEVSLGDFDEMLAVNLRASFRPAQRARLGPGRQAREARRGRRSGAGASPQSVYDQPGRRAGRRDLPAVTTPGPRR